MRHLTAEEIATLEANHCSAQDWQKITVSEEFTPHRCKYVRFYGHCSIGNNNGYCSNRIGYDEPYGIRNATIVSCNIGNHVIIEEIADVLANYDIEDHCIIKNVGKLAVDHETSFGNGVSVPVLNEMGGREVRIFNELSAQIAHVVAMYRHDSALIQAIDKLVDQYVLERTSSRGRVGHHSVIKRCGKIKNVYFGDYSDVEGASQLINGTVNSCQLAPVEIGCDVNATDFIISAGTKVTNGVQIHRCFIGQACKFASTFSAHDSLFFANCQGENGEACAVFAGPYTVSMHKSSLLIAGYYSFLNAGSGSNQSNHLYKLGPLHQGIVERGSKTTSDSYILWPSRIGAFSLIMGRHVSHIDSSSFPFSYLIENQDHTYLVPGVNLRSVGTIRDAQKWPNRDRRKEEIKLDCINFNLLSPYTVGRMRDGYQMLATLDNLLHSDNKVYLYKNMYIQGASLRKGMKYYKMGIEKFLGNSLIQRLMETEFSTEEEMQKALLPNGEDQSDDWLDICGLIAPRKSIQQLLKDIKQGRITSLKKLNEEFRAIHKNYYKLEWNWSFKNILEWNSIRRQDLTLEVVKDMVQRWLKAVHTLDDLLYEDAKKEFNLSAQVGFGVDIDPSLRVLDFHGVRGDFDTNPFVVEIQSHKERKQALFNSVMEKLNSITPSRELQIQTIIN